LWGCLGEVKTTFFFVIDKREPIIGVSAPKVKGMRELKNLDCSISLVKCQRQWGFLGLKMHFPFPMRCSRGFGLLGLFVGSWGY
jgi:hypothetical protein